MHVGEAAGRARARHREARARRRERPPQAAAFGALLRLVAVRIARRPVSSAIVVAGVALAVLAVGGSRLASTAARDASLRAAIAAAPADDVTFRAGVFRTTSAGGEVAGMGPGAAPPGGDGGEYAQRLDPRTTRALPVSGFDRRVTRAVLFSSGAEAAGGLPVRLVGLDDPAAHLALTRGRAPAPCRATSCEAVLAGGRAPAGAELRIGHLRLRIVGRGRLDAGPAGPIPPRAMTTIGARDTFLVVGGVRAIGRQRAVGLIPRTYYWSRRLAPGGVHPWNLDRVRAEVRQRRAALTASGARASGGPDRVLAGQATRGAATGARLGLLVGEAAAALLAFAAFAATQRRRDLLEELDRVRDAGATRLQLGLVVAAEAVALALCGVVAGVVLAAAAAVGLGGAGVLANEVATPAFALLVVACLVAATAALALGARPPQPRRRTLGAGEIALAAGLGVGLWQALTRGALTADDLVRGGGDPAVLLLPALVVAAAALLTWRTLPVALHGLERATRRAGPAARLTVLSLARDAARSGTTVAMVAAAGAVGLFAIAYATTLRAGAADQAAFATGSDVRVIEPPGRASLPARRYAAVPGVAAASPVIRRVADRLDAANTQAGTVALLGVPAREVGRLAGWRDDLAPQSRAELARRLGPTGSYRLAGDPIPRGARALHVRVRVDGSALIASLAIQGPDGSVTRAPIVQERSPRRLDATVGLTPQQRGGRVVALLVTTALGGADQDAVQASIALGALRAGDTVVTRFGRAWKPGPEAAAYAVHGRTLSFSLQTTRSAFALTRAQPGARQPLPGVLSGGLARSARIGDIVPVRLTGGQIVSVRVAGLARELPTVAAGRDAVLVDGGRLFAAANAADPGAIAPTETWLRLRPGAASAAAVAALPRGTRATGREAGERALATDPLARASGDVLVAVGLIALALAGAALVLSVSTALRDERGELAELEALGLAPATLRRQVHAGAAFLALAGAAGAAAGGAVLLAIVLALVHLSGEGRTPLPRLQPHAPWALLALVALATLALAGALVAALSARALRGDEAGRLGG